MADQAGQGLLSPILQRLRVNAARGFLKGRVLDIGCGNGVLAEFCNPTQYYGYDTDQETVEIARSAHSGFRFERSLPDAGETFDTIVGLAVIEHLPNPASHLRVWRSYLKSSGSIVLTTPHPSMDWLHALGASVGLFSREANDEHEDLLDNHELAQIGRECSLNLTHYERFLFGANQLAIYRPSSKHE